MEKTKKKQVQQELPETGALKKELKRERYKRRFRRLLRIKENTIKKKKQN